MHFVGTEDIIKLVLAILLGTLIGLERELKGKPAGLRTNILIILGSTLVMMISYHVARGPNGQLLFDPGRIAAQVVTGIGFIGAGSILQTRGTVVGLTTAATIWVVATIGLVIGCGHYFLAIAATGFILICLVVLGRAETWLLGKRKFIIYEINSDPKEAIIEEMQDLIRRLNLHVEETKLIKEADHYKIHYSVGGAKSQHQKFVRKVLGISGIREVSHSTI